MASHQARRASSWRRPEDVVFPDCGAVTASAMIRATRLSECNESSGTARTGSKATDASPWRIARILAYAISPGTAPINTALRSDDASRWLRGAPARRADDRTAKRWSRRHTVRPDAFQ